MGASPSNEKLPDNVFVVRNIHDDNRKFPKGVIEVTQVKLKYKDSQSGNEWVWPLKYLHKYGCDRDIFSFEAGRKCPGGEGLYAFSTKKASQLYDMVARNISEGGLEREDVGVLSPQDVSQGASPPEMTPSSAGPSPHPPPPPTSNPPSHLPPNATPRLPEYMNVNYQDGQHVVVLAATSSAGPSPHPPPPPTSNPPSHLPPNATPRLPEYMNVNYQDGQHVVVLAANSFITGRAHSQSTSAVQDSTSGGPTLLYQNTTMSKCNAALPTIPEDSEAVPSGPHVQANYVNIHPNPALGGGQRGTAPAISHRENSNECLRPLARHESDAQATYQNLQIGKGVSPPRTSNSLLSTSPPRVSGPKMGIYAQLDLSGPTTSTPKGKGDAPGRRKSSKDEENYMTLNFVAPASNNNTPEPMESSRSTTRHSPPRAQLQLSENRSATENSSLQPAAALIQDRAGDNTTVNYSTIDFNVTRALRLTKEQREQEIKERLAEEALEEERRKREEAANPGKKKKEKKGKKKDRRNRHQ